MIFAHFMTEVNEANVFVAACEETREALLVDAACFDLRIKAFLEAQRLELKAVFITHDHYDHVGGLGDLVKEYNPVVYAARRNVGDAHAQVVGQDDMIRVGRIEGKVIDLAGHTPTSIGLVLPSMVFSGDALFAGSIGGTTNEQDRDREIGLIRKHIFSLPDEYQVHTGHGPSTTVRIEKTYNPFFV